MTQVGDVLKRFGFQVPPWEKAEWDLQGQHLAWGLAQSKHEQGGGQWSVPLPQVAAGQVTAERGAVVAVGDQPARPTHFPPCSQVSFPERQQHGTGEPDCLPGIPAGTPPHCGVLGGSLPSASVSSLPQDED